MGRHIERQLRRVENYNGVDFYVLSSTSSDSAEDKDSDTSTSSKVDVRNKISSNGIMELELGGVKNG